MKKGGIKLKKTEVKTVLVGGRDIVVPQGNNGHRKCFAKHLGEEYLNSLGGFDQAQAELMLLDRFYWSIKRNIIGKDKIESLKPFGVMVLAVAAYNNVYRFPGKTFGECVRELIDETHHSHTKALDKEGIVSCIEKDQKGDPHIKIFVVYPPSLEGMSGISSLSQGKFDDLLTYIKAGAPDDWVARVVGEGKAKEGISVRS